jgi:hypothetical protein
MVRKLTNQQIRDYWDELKPAIVASFPRTPKNKELWLSELLAKGLTDQVTFWVGTEGEFISLLLLTTSFVEPITQERSLLVYAPYGFRPISEELWKEMAQAGTDHARALGCSTIVAYSEIPRVVEISKALGADTRTTFIQWRL